MNLIQYSSLAVQNWTRFWFSRSDPRLLCKLRIAIGLFTLMWFYSMSTDLNNWFGPAGLAPDSAVNGIMENSPNADDANRYRWSVFRLTNSTTTLWIIHLIAFCSACAFLLGLATPFAGAITFFALVSYTHRAPMLFGKTENVLTFAILYLCIAPCAQYFSLDRRFRKIMGRDQPNGDTIFIRANVSVRLLQVHLAMIYIFSALSKLGGNSWWQGDAVWWLAIQPETALRDFTGLAQNVILMNIWTHAIIAVELSMGILIWIRPLRSVLVVLSSLIWISLLPLTGDVGYCVLMIVLNFAFFDKMVTNSENESSESQVEG